MPDKYHIKTQPIPPRKARIGKHGVVDWREDCARCHNCVKKACVYDRYRQEADYIRNLGAVDALFFECMGCFSCVQDCTKNLLRLTVNPEYERLGNSYWKPDIIRTTWVQAETAKIPVSGAGYRGPFAGKGFDSMWTDMSEIVRPTRDGIHGREYISTSVDIGRTVSFLPVDGDAELPPLHSIPMPLIADLVSPKHTLPNLYPLIEQAAADTSIIAVVPSDFRPANEDHLENLAFYLGPDSAPVPDALLKKTRLVEMYDGKDVANRIAAIKKINPDIVVAVRIALTAEGVERAIELGSDKTMEAIHIVADENGDELGTSEPRFIKDILRHIHTTLVDRGIRDEVTIIAGGGIALPEHLAKAMICGADVISINLPLMIGLECHLCESCSPGMVCPAHLEDIDFAYGVGRMTNLIAAWHDQLIELMGAMGIREARRLRGEVGRAMFFENLEEETFGRLYGKRKKA
jgi:ferredoxin